MTVLLCTTEDFLLTSLEYRFRKNHWKLEVAHSAQKAYQKVEEAQPDIVLVDLKLSDYQALDIVQHLTRELCPGIPILIGGPLDGENLLMEALRLGARDFIIAPFKPEELIMRIRHQVKLEKVAG